MCDQYTNLLSPVLLLSWVRYCVLFRPWIHSVIQKFFDSRQDYVEVVQSVARSRSNINAEKRLRICKSRTAFENAQPQLRLPIYLR